MSDEKPAVDTDKAKMKDLAETEKKQGVVDQQTAGSAEADEPRKD